MTSDKRLLKPTEYGLPAKFSSYLKGQAEAIESVEAQFKDGKRIVFLDAPTGSGKSLSAVLLAKRLAPLSALIMVQTKQLGEQYAQDFPSLVTVKGRGNFRCALQPELSCDEGLCGLSHFKCEDKHFICPYYIQKNEAASAALVATNAAFFLNEANYAGGRVCGRRELLVIDEGHQLENSLMGFVSITVPERSLKLVDLDLPDLSSPQDAKEWATGVWPILADKVQTLASAARSSGPSVSAEVVRRLLRFRRMTDRLGALARIEVGQWFLAQNRSGYELRPFLVDEFVEPLVTGHADRVLMMSATFLSPRVMARLLGFERSKVGWHQMDSSFPVERRPYNFVPVVKINYRTKSVGYQRLVKAIDQVLERHASEKGVVHTASFRVMNEVLKRTRFPRRFIHHRPSSQHYGSGLTRDEAIDHFLRDGDSAVLISPSVGLGLDLHDDLCRFQVVAKLPYLSLGNPQVKHRQKQDPEWYAWTTIAGIVQASGRSTRHARDYSTVYLLDSSLHFLLKKYPYLFPKWWKKAFHKVDSVSQAYVAVSG